MDNSLTSKGKFSIILPVKNGGNYVKECVDSILSQSVVNFTLHILENCSSDGTWEYLQSLHDERIVLIPASSPLTMEANWERITTIDKNEFITIIGHDDIFHPQYLETMNSLIQSHPGASLYQTHFLYMDAEGNAIRKCQSMPETLTAAEFIGLQITRAMDSMGTGYMMRSKDYDRIGGIPGRYPNLIFADYELWVKLTNLSYLAISKEEAFSYRLHNNISKQTNGEAYKKAFGEYMLFLNELKNTDPEVAAVIARHGKGMLLYFCESLSHRLLKTNRVIRTTSIRSFIGECRHYAGLLIPAQSFNPMLKPGILAAYLLDNKPGLKLFNFYKKIMGQARI